MTSRILIFTIAMDPNYSFYVKYIGSYLCPHIFWVYYFSLSQCEWHCFFLAGCTVPAVNLSPMSPKLVQTYPYRVEIWGIAMVSLFLRLILINVICNQLNCTIYQKISNNIYFDFNLLLNKDKAIGV